MATAISFNFSIDFAIDFIIDFAISYPIELKDCMLYILLALYYRHDLHNVCLCIVTGFKEYIYSLGVHFNGHFHWDKKKGASK